MFGEIQGYARQTGRRLWRGGRQVVGALRAGDNFGLIRRAHLPAPLALGIMIGGWLPRWGLNAIEQSSMSDDALQIPAIPTSVTLFSAVTTAIAGIGAVAGFVWLFDAGKTMLHGMPVVGAIATAVAGVATAIYITMKFDDFHHALTPNEDPDAENHSTSERIRAWARNFFTYNHIFNIDPAKDTAWYHHAGKIGGTLITAGSAVFFAVSTFSALPIAFPLAVTACAAYGLGEYFEAHGLVSNFYGHLKESFSWLTGSAEAPKERLVDSNRWNTLPFWKRGPLYMTAGLITATIAVPIAFIAPPVWAAPLGLLMGTFLYPLFLQGVKSMFRDPHEEDHEVQQNGRTTPSAMHETANPTAAATTASPSMDPVMDPVKVSTDPRSTTPPPSGDLKEDASKGTDDAVAALGLTNHSEKSAFIPLRQAAAANNADRQPPAAAETGTPSPKRRRFSMTSSGSPVSAV